MALNSFVTSDGKEMGRAQVLQAAACGLAPDVRMNPVLLKPDLQHGVAGYSVGRTRGADARGRIPAVYYSLKAVRKAYNCLCTGMDVMVLEGAGSPAEINLREHDIKHAHGPACWGSGGSGGRY